MSESRKYPHCKVPLAGKSEKNGKIIVTLFCILIKIRLFHYQTITILKNPRKIQDRRRHYEEK